MTQLFIAYGTHMNLRQMQKQCPNAKKIGLGVVKDYQLTFRGTKKEAFANLEQKQGVRTPVVIWELGHNDERNLDEYEEYPNLYAKESLSFIFEDGTTMKGMTYIMNEGYELGMPSKQYYACILEGYVENQISPVHLITALTFNTIRMDEVSDMKESLAMVR